MSKERDKLIKEFETLRNDLTPTQQHLLDELDSGKWTFPGPRESRSYDRLESLGLVVGELKLFSFRYDGKEMEYRRAYRLKKEGT